METALQERDFRQFQSFLYESAGIHLTDAKRHLVAGRLAKRLRDLGLASYREYLGVISGKDNDERRIAVDLLTTNETYFFREDRHFDFIKSELLPQWKGSMFRAWSAACSSGEEPYSLAMVLDAGFGSGGRWEMLATDISSRVLERARSGLYKLEAAERIPRDYLNRHCLRGTREHEGWFRIGPALRQRIAFRQLNLNGDAWSGVGQFDLIMLRNVMIYFDTPTKRRLVARMTERLAPGGILCTGLSESLHGMCDGMKSVAPSVYRKL